MKGGEESSRSRFGGAELKHRDRLSVNYLRRRDLYENLIFFLIFKRQKWF